MQPSQDFNLDHLHSLIDQCLADETSVSEPTTALSEEVLLVLPQTEVRSLQAIFDVCLADLGQAKAFEILSLVRNQVISTPVARTSKQLHIEVSHCSRCTQTSSRPFLPLGNSTNPKIVFVHEFPTFTNSNLFNGFQEEIEKAQILQSNCLHTSITRCQFDSKKLPTDTEINNCFPYLYEELELYKPQVIVLIGANVASYLLGADTKIMEERGMPIIIGPWCLYPTISFSHASRDEGLMNLLRNDLSMIKTLASQ